MIMKNPRSCTLGYQFNRGFTLIELMAVVMIIALLAAIAIPSYQHFTRRAIAAQAQQEMQKLAEQLERHKSRNFSYKGFNASYLYPLPFGSLIDSFDPIVQVLTLPLQSATTQYTVTILDGSNGNPPLNSTNAIGQSWAITAVSSDVRNFSFLITSSGLKCRTISPDNLNTDPGSDLEHPDEIGCGAGGENW